MLCPQCGRENPPEGAPGATCGCGTGVAGAGPLEPWASTEVSDNVDGTRSQTNQARSWDETADTAFVGRHREMDVLKSALEDVLSGRGRLVMLSGELGIGKTRTAQELAAQAETRGARVLWGRCYEDFGAPPYWPWVQLLRSYIQLQDPQRLQVEMGPGAADIAGIIPELRSKLPHLEPPPVLEPEQARFRLFDAIATLLGNAALSQALVLVIDDLHWSDRSSLLLLEFIARELAGSPLLLLGTYRNVELSRSHPLAQSLGDLVKEPSFRRVALQGLSRQEVGLLVESAGVSPQGDLVDAVQARTEGNPFFVSEVVRLLQQEGLETGQTWDLRIPEGVRDAIGRRLSRLSGPCRQVLTLASVAGREFDFRLLEKLQVSTEDDFLEVLEEALGAHLIGEVPRSVGRYQFSHGLVQETLLGELSTARRLRLHARIGEALEELYGANAEAHAAELSYHFGQAEMTTGNQKSAHYSFLAGEQALSAYAWEEALRYFRQALAAKEGQPMDTQTASILFGLGRAQEVTLGRFEFQEYIPNMRRAFEYYAETGQVAPAVAVAEYPVRVVPGVPVGWAGLIGRALELVPPGSQLDARLQSTYGNALYVETGDYNGAREAFGRALTIARRERDAALEMRTLASAARVDFLHLRFQESMEEALRVIDLARSLDDLSCEVAARITLGWQMWCGGGGEMTTRNARELRSLADRLGNRTGLIEALEQGGRLCCLKGDWSGAREFFDRGLTLAPQDPRLLCSRAMLEYETGNFDLGGEYHRAILDQMGSAIMGLQFPWVAQGLSVAACITGDDSKLEVAESASRTVHALPGLIPWFAGIRNATLALQAVARNDTAAAEVLYDALELQQGIMLGYVSSDRLLGLLSATKGRLDHAVSHFEDSLAFSRRAGYRPELAWSQCDYADALLQRNRAGDRAKARDMLEEALAISQELGMGPLMERAEARLSQVKALPRGASSCPNQLTPREVEVLQLIATGKTNQQIADTLVISLRTVANHVAAILNKTGSANRAEAATYASRHGLV